MPAYVTGEGDPYRPEALVWMGANGALLGSTLAKPGEAARHAAESLRNAIEKPMFGRAHAPARVRVASPEIADALRIAHPSIAVTCAPTPELDAVLSMMQEKMADDAEANRSYFSPGVDAAAIASMFHAVAGLYRSKPWEIVPTEHNLISFTSEKLNVRDATLVVIGQAGESYGVILFSGVEQWDAYLEAVDAIQHGDEPDIPAHFALNFEQKSDLAVGLLSEIERHHWEVADGAAYPWLLAADRGGIPRAPTADEVTTVEAISRALPEMLRDRDRLAAAWECGESVARTMSVQTHAGEFEVTLQILGDDDDDHVSTDINVIDELFAMDQEGEELDVDERQPLEEELVRQFEASPEATGADSNWCHHVMNYGADHFGVTIATIGPRDLREIVFEIIPRRFSVDSSRAGEIIDELRAFYAFLKREFELDQADACLRVLGGDAAKKLKAALSDRSRFGMAKSLFMAGRDAGYDIESREGVEAWMRVLQSGTLPDSIQLPPLPRMPPIRARPVDAATAKAKKNRRKATRHARKKNR